MPHRSETGQLFGVIKGAVYGKPYTDVPDIHTPSEYPKLFPANPNSPVLLETIKNTLESQNLGYLQGDSLPWSSQRIDIHKLFRSLIAFSDDHTEPIHSEYFPVSESRSFIDNVIDKSKSNGAPLLLQDQLNIAMEYTDGQLLAASILCHSASRAIGRNKDQRVDHSFNFDSDTMRRWSASIARFEDPNQFDPPGDTYHFWAAFSMGIALRRNYHQYPNASRGYKFLFDHGADITNYARRFIARNPLQYKHKEIDKMGLELGWELGS